MIWYLRRRDFARECFCFGDEVELGSQNCEKVYLGRQKKNIKKNKNKNKKQNNNNNNNNNNNKLAKKNTGPAILFILLFTYEEQLPS